MKKTMLICALISAATGSAHADSLATFYGAGRIADGGAAVNASVSIEKEGDKLRLHLVGDVKNELLVQAVSPTVIVTLVAKDGTLYTEAHLDLPQTPGRGFPWNGAVARGGASDLVLEIDAEGSQGLGEVRWRFYDRAAPNPVPSLLKGAIDIIVPLLLK